MKEMQLELDIFILNTYKTEFIIQLQKELENNVYGNLNYWLILELFLFLKFLFK